MLVISFRRGFFFFFDAPSSSSTGAAEKGDDSVHEEGAFEAAVVVRVHVVMKLRLRPELVEFY